MQQAGIGSGFMKSIEEKAAEKGAVYITLLTEKQVPAYQYRKNGFQERKEKRIFC